MKLVGNYLFLAAILFLGVILDLGKYIFLEQTYFIGVGGGHHGLESSRIWINTVFASLVCIKWHV